MTPAPKYMINAAQKSVRLASYLFLFLGTFIAGTIWQDFDFIWGIAWLLVVIFITIITTWVGDRNKESWLFKPKILTVFTPLFIPLGVIAERMLYEKIIPIHLQIILCLMIFIWVWYYGAVLRLKGYLA